MDELTLAVVGIDFPNRDGGNRRFELLQCDPGDPVELRPEPRNPHDPRAVAVLSGRGQQIGYLTAERAQWIGSRIRAGEAVTAVFQGAAGRSGFIRVAFGGRLPTLPPVHGGVVAPLPEEGARDPDGPIWGA